jgi:catechol 2,3-dioxygenase-like lactoylglutathione lyase family enzyme
MPLISFHHVKLDVEDLGRSLDFYCGLLGLKQIVRYDRDDGVSIVQLSTTGQPPGVELWHEPPWAGLRNERLHFAFAVTGLASLVEDLRTRGVVVEIEPFTIGHEKIAFLRDPDGYLIELNES